MSMRRVFVPAAAAALVLAMAPSVTAAEGEATIIRDEYGVPHIYADTAHDLFYAFGYMSARKQGRSRPNSASGPTPRRAHVFSINWPTAPSPQPSITS